MGAWRGMGEIHGMGLISTTYRFGSDLSFVACAAIWGDRLVTYVVDLHYHPHPLGPVGIGGGKTNNNIITPTTYNKPRLLD